MTIRFTTREKTVSKAKTLLCLFVLISSTGFAQSGFIESLKTNWNSFNSSILKEKIFLHTDRDLHLAGETLWFKAYLTNQENRLSGISKVAYIDIIDSASKPVIQGKISLHAGTGNGSLYLPQTLRSGRYLLRAYTNLLKNFGQESFFQKRITIINTLRADSGSANNGNPPTRVQMLPEGGNMVYGIESNVAFKLSGENATDISYQGAIINERNDTVLKFKPLRSGIGTFKMTPDASSKYRIVVLSNTGRKIAGEFPTVLSTGFVMTTDIKQTKYLSITVKANVSDSRIYLVAHAQGKIKDAQQTLMQNGAASFSVNKDLLADGVNCITLFDENRRPVCERLYFKSPVNRYKITAESHTTYGKRQKVAVNISAGDVNRGLRSSLSMSVYRLSGIQKMPVDDIETYFLIQSELKGMNSLAESYLPGQDPQKEVLLDNLMLSYGWRRFNWSSILNDQKQTPEFLPEYEGNIVSVLIKNSSTGAPVPGITAYLSIPGTKVQMYTAVSDSSGLARFNTKDVYGQAEVILQSYPSDLQPYSYEILSPFDSSPAKDKMAPLSRYPDSLAPTLLKSSINMQLSSIFASGKTRYTIPYSIDSAFYGRPNKTYLLDDYTRFATIEEVLREYIPEIWLQRKSGELVMAVFDSQSRLLFNSEPLALLDGVPVLSFSKILRFDPLKIKAIDIVTNRYFWGPLSFDGIVNFKTYKGDLGTFELDPKDVVVDYQGLLEERNFYAPEYPTEEAVKSRIPDFRELLFWSPEITIDPTTGKAEINFYTSDQTGQYIGVIQGLAEDGSIINERLKFTVK